MMVTANPSIGPASWLNKILDTFCSIWLGVVLLVMIFTYSTIGSAYPPFRQQPGLEMTEFQWFHWWPFDLLIALFTLNMVLATIRKIPLRVTTAGVWMIHSGIVILVLGSFWYFGSKLEGDAPIFRRQVMIRLPGSDQVTAMYIRPDNRLSLTGPDGQYTFAIADLQPEWPIQSEPHVGEKAYSVSVQVTTPHETFIRQLLAGYPQYTEDVIPGEGRAIKKIGRKLIDENLQLALDYNPQNYLYLNDSSALYVRPADQSVWIEKPIAELPNYHDHVADRSQVIDPSGRISKNQPLNLVMAQQGEQDPLAGVEVTVLSYLRYAQEQTRWAPGGPQLNPIVRLRADIPQQGSQVFELAAKDAEQQTAANGQIAMHWVENQTDLQQLQKDETAFLRIQVPSAQADLKLTIDELRQQSATWLPIPDTDYQFRLQNTVDKLAMGDGRLVSIAMVEVRKGESGFLRMVADDPQSTRDMASSEGGMGHEMLELDKNIVMEYHPDHRALLNVVAGPAEVGLHMIFRDANGQLQSQATAAGQTTELPGGVKITIEQYIESAQREVLPMIVPVEQRDSKADRQFAMIQLQLQQGNWQQKLWLPYNPWALDGDQYGFRGRIPQFFRPVQLPDGRRVELLFSRERYELPAAVALDDFTLETHAGGLIGSNSNVRNYISKLRFADGQGGWSEPMQMSLNNPANHQGWWFFQSTWDPPQGNYAGMNYTGVGVGNRNGVQVQLAGTVLAVLGMIYAFYLKPMIIRRKIAAAQAGKTLTAYDPSQTASLLKTTVEDTPRVDAAEHPVDALKARKREEVGHGYPS
ncbi:MAG: hypothetical protein HJJLKODD_00294 [Phycisphaerae bacterium]|nr:hypothetical protein [Phycisphaerae bacterium]